MEMKNPPHPGELIGDNLTELDVSIVEATKALGITRQQLHNLIAGRSAITPEMAAKLEMEIGGTAAAWLRMQMNLRSRAGPQASRIDQGEAVGAGLNALACSIKKGICKVAS